MPRIYFYSLIFYLSTVSGNLFSQKDTLARKPTFSVFPLVYYTPETDWAFGAGAISNVNFGKTSENTFSSLGSVGAAYTLLNQLLIYSSWRIFTNQNQHIFAGEVGWYRSVFFIYGLGPEVLEDNREQFNANLSRFRFDYLKKTSPDFFVGIRYWYDNYNITLKEKGGLLEQESLLGNKGGRISGLGPLLYFDSRDSQLYPTRGIFAETSIQYYGKALGSDFNYGRWMGDLRRVQSLKENQVFVWQAYSEVLIGEAPFFALPMMGGNRLMRGLFEGKFRDQNMLLLQGEYRWKFLPRWGAVVFSGVGNVFSETNPFQLNQTKFTYGLGGRFQIRKNEKLNFRLDLSHSPGEDFKIYLTFGEAF